MDAPQITMKLPGPKAAALIAKDEQWTSPSYTRPYPLAVARGLGAVIEDVDGNRFLDFTAGIAVCATGHCHPRVVAAIRNQADQLLHMSGTDFYYGPQADLAAKLAELAPGAERKRVFFTNSGAEAVEAAFKLARYKTGRPHMVAFLGAFHGRTMGALSLTGSKAVQRRGFSPLVPQVTHIEYPRCQKCSQQTDAGCCLKSIEQLETLFRHTLPPDEVAAIFVEPIQGEGGYLVPPPEFLPALKKLAEQHGILLVADEVQAGMGRTGKMFACQHDGIEPDILCLAKGIASGMPLGAIVARESVMDWPPGSHASTFGGNPVACAAALATIDLLEEELMENASQVGDYLQSRLRELADTHPLVVDVRGRGLMVGMELGDPQGHPAKEQVAALIDGCFHQGLLLLSCGLSTIRFCPPLVVTRKQVDAAVKILDSVLTTL